MYKNSHSFEELRFDKYETIDLLRMTETSHYKTKAERYFAESDILTK